MVYIMGGTCFSEFRVGYEITNERKNWEVIVGGSQILTPEGFLNKIKGLSDGGDEPSDEWRVTFSRELKGKSINDDDEEKKNKIMKQTVKKWTAMMMQHRCFEIWIPLSYVLLLLLSLLYLKPKEQTVSLLYMKKMKSVMIASVCVLLWLLPQHCYYYKIVS